MFADLLKTRRLVLRPPTDLDAAPMSQLLNNWHVVKKLAKVPYPYRRADAEIFLTRIRQGEQALGIVYAITLAGEFIGVISIAPEPGGENLGYWLGEPYWGQGLITEAVAAMVTEYFRQAGNQALFSGIVQGNAASLAVQRKFGFEVIGESRIMCVARGVEMPGVDTVLTRQRYEELQS